jgi:hypothetical protein
MLGLDFEMDVGLLDTGITVTLLVISTIFNLALLSK